MRINYLTTAIHGGGTLNEMGDWCLTPLRMLLGQRIVYHYNKGMTEGRCRIEEVASKVEIQARRVLGLILCSTLVPLIIGGIFKGLAATFEDAPQIYLKVSNCLKRKGVILFYNGLSRRPPPLECAPPCRTPFKEISERVALSVAKNKLFNLESWVRSYRGGSRNELSAIFLALNHREFSPEKRGALITKLTKLSQSPDLFTQERGLIRLEKTLRWYPCKEDYILLLLQNLKEEILDEAATAMRMSPDADPFRAFRQIYADEFGIERLRQPSHHSFLLADPYVEVIREHFLAAYSLSQLTEYLYKKLNQDLYVRENLDSDWIDYFAALLLPAVMKESPFEKMARVKAHLFESIPSSEQRAPGNSDPAPSFQISRATIHATLCALKVAVKIPEE